MEWRLTVWSPKPEKYSEGAYQKKYHESEKIHKVLTNSTKITLLYVLYALLIQTI